MRNRWGILAVLFTVRLTMGFQFQSVAAVAPLLGSEFGVGIADIGLLIGLYFTPGVALALPGGAIGQKIGDKLTVLGALLLMLAGGLMMAFSTSWSAQIAGRLIAGTGGVLMNVQMTKMVADWFAGREIATAMAVFVNSWPAGVAIALLVLPSIGIINGVAAVYLSVTAVIACGIVLLAIGYEAPPTATLTAAVSGRLDRVTVLAVITAGLIWGCYNVAFATIFSFGPAMLVERGWSITTAGSAISIVLWLTVLSVPAGGVLADRTGQPGWIMVAGWTISAALLLALAHGSAVIPVTIALGLICGLPGGPIMSLPARVLQPANRAMGMGLFFTVYYAAMMVGPVIGGACAKWAGSAAAAFDFGAAMMLLCPALLWGFNRMTASVAKQV